jgi:hypothetical protein
MPYTIPNEADAANVNQAEPDSKDFDIMVAGHKRTGVVGLCTVTAQGVPNMTVAVAAGRVLYQGVPANVAGGNITIQAADATNPRFDYVMVDNTGALVNPTAGDGKGTASANPVFPAIPVNRVVLAAVYVAATVTTIVTGNIVDKRVFIIELPTGRMRNTANQAFSTGVEAKVTFDTSVFDSGGPVVDLGNDRLVAQAPGIYLIVAEIHYAITVGSGGILINLRLNGATDIAKLNFPSESQIEATLTCLYKTSPDYVEVFLTSTAGNSNVQSPRAPSLSMTKVADA